MFFPTSLQFTWSLPESVRQDMITERPCGATRVESRLITCWNPNEQGVKDAIVYCILKPSVVESTAISFNVHCSTTQEDLIAILSAGYRPNADSEIQHKKFAGKQTVSSNRLLDTGVQSKLANF